MPTLDEQIVLAISADITNLRRAVVQMGGVVSTMAKQQEQLFNKVGNAANDNADKVIRSSRRMRTAVINDAEAAASASIRENSRASAYAVNNARNLSFQINDVISGLATGGGMRAVAQQFGQIAQSFAGTGIVATIGAMFTKANLLTIALTAAGAAATYFFSETEDGAQDAVKEIENLNGILNKFKDVLPEAEQGLLKRALGEIEIGESLTGLRKVRDAFRELAGIAVKGIKLPAMPGLGKALDDNVQMIKIVDDLGDQWEDLIKTIESGQDPTEKVNKLLLQLDGIELIAPGQGAKQLAQVLRDQVIPLLEKATDREKAMKAILEALGKVTPEMTEKQEKFNKAIEEMQGIAVPALTEMEKLMKAYQEATANATDEMARLRAESELAAGIYRLNEEAMDDATDSVRDFIKARESFRAEAYWDVNHFRVGFGSDKYVDEMGNIRDVTRDTVVTVAQANKDLDRRIREFQNTIRRQIGGDVFEAMSEDQKKALTSIAYNYGDLPNSIVKAIKTGDHGQVARAISALATDNAGVNASRRRLEADVYARGSEGQEAALSIEKQTEAQKEENDETRERLKLSGDLTEAFDEETYKRVYAAELSSKMAEAERNARERNVPLTKQEIELIKQRADEAAKLAAQEEGAKQARETAEDIEARLQALRDENEQLEKKAELLGTTLEALIALLPAEEQEKATNEAKVESMKVEQELRAKGIQLTKEQIAAVEELNRRNSLGKAALKGFEVSTKEATKAAEDFNNQLAGVFKSAISGFISDLRNGMDAGEAFAKMLDRIIDGLINMALEMLFSKQLLGGLFGGGIGGGVAGMGGVGSFFSKGGVVGKDGERGRVDPRWWIGAPSFARGGPVLPYGAVPIVAHAGETVLPKGAKIGGGDVTNNVGDIKIDMSGTGMVTSTTESGKLLGRQIQAAVEVVLVRESQPGGILRRV